MEKMDNMYSEDMSLYESTTKEWVKRENKNALSKVITRCLHNVCKQWNTDDTEKLVYSIERLVYPIIDTEKLLLSGFESHGGSFDLHILQDIVSDELLDMILEYHSEKWQVIRRVFMEDGLVDLVYEDRYVNTPLGCILLAQFIRRIRDLFRLRFRSITLIMSKKDFREIFDDETLKLDRKFSHVENRDAFLSKCMEQIVEEPYEIQVKNTKHSRSLTIRNCHYELDIYPDGGISYGWGIENGRDKDLTVDQLKNHVDRNIRCFNRASRTYDRKGIIYTVKLSPILIHGKKL